MKTYVIGILILLFLFSMSCNRPTYWVGDVLMHPNTLDFSYENCSSPNCSFEKPGLGIRSIRWTNGNYLEVKAIVEMDCSLDISSADYELTPEMAGVQCEACHGPGSVHVAGPMKNNIIKESGASLCRQCHTKGQDPGFDYKEKARNVHGK